jgi:signal transduction histidine kinase
VSLIQRLLRGPDRLAPYIALVVVLSIVAVQAMTLLAAYVVRNPEVHAYSPRWVVQEVINAVTRIEAGAHPTPIEAARATDAANHLRFEWRERAPDTGLATPNDRLERFIAARLSQLLKGREVRVEVRRRDGVVPRFARPRVITVPAEDLQQQVLPQPPGPPPGRPPQAGEPGRPAPWREWVLTGNFEIAVQVRPDGWLIVRGLDAAPFIDGPLALLFWLALAAIVIGVISWVAARRLVRPLRKLAASAEHLGLHRDATPVPESGPLEVRTIAQSLNRMSERVSRFVEDRTRMVAAISHDLRTPLTRLRLRAELVVDEQTRAKILADIRQMEQIVGETLAWSREDAARGPRGPVDIAALLLGLSEDATDSGKAVRYDGPSRVVLNCHAGAVRRALDNLVDNAVAYGGEAEVTLRELPQAVEIEVADRGPGIPQDQLDRVFAPFVRLEESRNRDTGGAGLGLAIARDAIRAHGGDIRLENRKDGKGLRATVTLPKTQAPSALAIAAQ